MKEVVALTKTYRVTPFVRMGNLFTRAMIRGGLRIRNSALLTVTGRKSGKPRSVPVAIAERDGERYLIGAFGVVNWVRNLRAAGQATLTRGRHTEAISVTELPTAEAARFLKQVVSTAPGFIRGYFDVTPASSLEEFEREAPRHPVFLVQPAAPLAADAPRETLQSSPR